MANIPSRDPVTRRVVLVPVPGTQVKRGHAAGVAQGGPAPIATAVSRVGPGQGQTIGSRHPRRRAKPRKSLTLCASS